MLPAVTRDAYARLLGELWGPTAAARAAALAPQPLADAVGDHARPGPRDLRRLLVDAGRDGSRPRPRPPGAGEARPPRRPRRPPQRRRRQHVLRLAARRPAPTGDRTPRQAGAPHRRFTFSAAGNFAAEVEASTRARIVGEPPAGAHNYGDSVPVELKALGWTVFVPPYVQVLGREDERAVLRPDVLVETRAADYFAARDPVLEKAMSLR